ncbi:DUF881 domain-containing protein [Actinomadura namibiensis]|uniref:Uncharacterized protein YlxW (UPF0749 family) n=1 Tax=Actinomadura namibiensis TaxID=182080 RepID=A0A7W3LRD8_ACTNM|nr:DUF881 domain-containing protein [Actinomadura namibiensis]MBA8952800.1 uncharacterized protein YlxW (UPF0749 family) [Actinomadura namibiensis]
MTGRQRGKTGEPRTGDRPPGWRPDASMSLLSDMFTGRLLDPGYAEAAARRARTGETAGRGLRGLRGTGVLLVLVLAGLLATVAGAEARRSEPVAAAQRSRLVEQIRARTGETDALQRRLERLGAETERLRAAALARSNEGDDARRALSAAEGAAAAAPASGPALVVVLDDAPRSGGDGRAGGRADEGRVYDQDIQVLVNGLWAAGATAIAINGQRLTPTTAVRTAGEAILVDYRPLSGPYEVTALGDPDRLERALRGSPADRRLRALADRFRMRYEWRRSASARLPAGSALRLRHARPLREREEPDRERRGRP